MNNKPNISWLILEDDAYVPYNEYMAEGSYSYKDTLIKRIQIWNNYGNNISVSDATNARLILSFKNYEDNFLLNLIKIRLTSSDEYLPIEYDIDRAIIDIGTIYGTANGTYKEIEIEIGPIPNNLRSELKSLIFYIEYDR